MSTRRVVPESVQLESLLIQDLRVKARHSMYHWRCAISSMIRDAYCTMLRTSRCCQRTAASRLCLCVHGFWHWRASRQARARCKGHSTGTILLGAHTEKYRIPLLLPLMTSPWVVCQNREPLSQMERRRNTQSAPGQADRSEIG